MFWIDATCYQARLYIPKANQAKSLSWLHETRDVRNLSPVERASGVSGDFERCPIKASASSERKRKSYQLFFLPLLRHVFAPSPWLWHCFLGSWLRFLQEIPSWTGGMSGGRLQSRKQMKFQAWFTVNLYLSSILQRLKVCISYVLYTVVPRNQAPGFSYKVENGSQTKAIIGKAIYALQ